MKQEGIFRKTGSLLRQTELKMSLCKNIHESDNSYFNVHDYASVLKSFLAELPEPIFTDAYYRAHCQLAGSYFRHLIVHKL